MGLGWGAGGGGPWERGEGRERGRERGGSSVAGRGWGRWWGDRRWVAAGERKRERKGKREKGGRRRPADRGWGRWWVTGVGGGSPAFVSGVEKVAGDGEDFEWEG
ncbi:hypothetical protein TIFTF001_053726 [Ficus carica]|uniref:Uncharacterized protein n=1 Tax=Ficus carica TaxID=3494 RepID=A0AA88EN76_FICCA|nr:hypothetical protein TIFTF001_053726 [Ficus carica]